MDEFEALVAQTVERYGNRMLVEITGPWTDPKAAEAVYICNWLDSTFAHRKIHPGSRGSTMLEALKAGIPPLEEYMAARTD